MINKQFTIKIEVNCLNSYKGNSVFCFPKNPIIKNEILNKIWLIFRILKDFTFIIKGFNKTIKKNLNKNKTPPTLSGKDFNIAKYGKKYHSGTICSGVDLGLDLILFNGSKRKSTLINKTIKKKRKKKDIINISFIKKKGKNGIIGDLDRKEILSYLPFLCRNRICTPISIKDANGNKKWITSKRETNSIPGLNDPIINLIK